MTTMKVHPDDENEFYDVRLHEDPDRNRLTPLVQLPGAAALAVVQALTSVVRKAHDRERGHPTPRGQLKRAQEFEEGDVYLVEPPFAGFFADRYLMDFYDVRSRDVCSRMHMHTGLRFVRMMTGPATTILVSSLSPILQSDAPHWAGGTLESFIDAQPGLPDGERRDRHNVVVPPNSWVDLQVPRGVSHQFNADGPHAVVDSVHPEESIEVLREGMSGLRMMAQTIFLAEDRLTADSCLREELG